MAATGWDEQVEAFADSVNGDETSAPLPGLPTVTLANTDAVVRPHRRAKEKTKAFFINKSASMGEEVRGYRAPRSKWG